MSAQFVFDAIGTKWVIDIYEDISSEEEMLLFSRIKERIAVFDKVYSRFRSDSLVSEMAEKDGIYTLPEDGKLLMSVYKKFYDITKGMMTPLIGQVLVDAGYDANYSLQQKKKLETPPTWDEVIIYEHPFLTLKQPALLDFGAAGKGYLIDLVGTVIEEQGIKYYCVDAGGDILHRRKEQELKVGLENPNNIEEAIGVILLGNKSIAASAGSQRKWGNFTHIINPRELSSPKEIVATWVIAESTILADALATALFFTSVEEVRKYFDFEYVVLHSDNSVEYSPRLHGELFTSVVK